jgi:hypothetical protein
MWPANYQVWSEIRPAGSSGGGQACVWAASRLFEIFNLSIENPGLFSGLCGMFRNERYGLPMTAPLRSMHCGQFLVEIVSG